jgi:hypothetical protein
MNVQLSVWCPRKFHFTCSSATCSLRVASQSWLLLTSEPTHVKANIHTGCPRMNILGGRGHSVGHSKYVDVDWSVVQRRLRRRRRRQVLTRVTKQNFREYVKSRRTVPTLSLEQHVPASGRVHNNRAGLSGKPFGKGRSLLLRMTDAVASSSKTFPPGTPCTLRAPIFISESHTTKSRARRRSPLPSVSETSSRLQEEPG